MVIAATFKALGDPIRLEILERLSSGASQTVGSVSKGLGLTRQGVRKHLQVLAEANLIRLKPNGRATEVIFDVATIKATQAFITTLEKRWDTRLEALRDFVEQDTK
jgi:DNA-binding transcriptional ArsR family regulator